MSTCNVNTLGELPHFVPFFEVASTTFVLDVGTVVDITPRPTPTAFALGWHTYTPPHRKHNKRGKFKRSKR